MSRRAAGEDITHLPPEQLAESILAKERRIAEIEELRARDEEMDELRRTQFRVMLSADWAYGVEAAVDVALLGRYYERIADHAASMGRRIIYVVTGQFPEEQIWPQP